jgi:hypothetical protein
MVRVRTVVAWLFLASLTGLIGATAASASVEVQKQWIGAPEFSGPEGIASDVSVVDQGNDRVLKFDPQGALVTEWGSSGTGNGQFNDPTGIAVDTSGNVFVTDFTNNRVQKFDSSGAFVSKWGTSGTGDGQFNGPVAGPHVPGASHRQGREHGSDAGEAELQGGAVAQPCSICCFCARVPRRST